MTVDERLACTNPQTMLEFLRGRASDRKLRLFACACCRRIWGLLAAEPLRQAVGAAERFADGLSGWDELEEASARAERAELPQRQEGRGRPHPAGAALGAARMAALLACSDVAARAAEYASAAVGYTTAPTMTSLLWRAAVAAERRSQAALLRDAFGNPFRPTALDPTWLTPTGVRLGQAAYEEPQLPSGELDTARLLVLGSVWHRIFWEEG